MSTINAIKAITNKYCSFSVDVILNRIKDKIKPVVIFKINVITYVSFVAYKVNGFRLEAVSAKRIKMITSAFVAKL